MKKTKTTPASYVWATARITLGFTFLWAFFDKLIGLGFSTCRGEDGVITTFCQKAWLEGGSPTTGFLKFATEDSYFPGVFQAMSGQAIWDWLFMAGLLGIGIALILGIAMRAATYSGALLLMLMYLAVGQPENNPVLDDHIIYAIVLIGLSQVDDRQVWGLRKWWHKQDIVKQYPILQ